MSLHPQLFAAAITGAFVFALATVGSSAAIRWTIDHVIVPRFDDDTDVAVTTVATGCALIVGIGILRAASVVMRRGFAGAGQLRVAESLSNRVCDRYVTQPASWHRRQRDGELVARAGVDVDATISALAPVPFAIGTVVMLVVAAVWLVSIDVVMGLVAISVFPILIVVNVTYQRRVDVHFNRAQDALGTFTGAVHESFEAVQLVKSYGAGARETERLSRLAASIRDARVDAVRLRGTFEAFLESVPSLTNIGLVVVGAARVRSGDVTVGDVSGVVYMFTLLVFPLRMIGYALSELPRAYSGYRLIEGVLGEPIDADPVDSIEPAADGIAVELDAVGFTYPDERSPVIDGIDLRIQRGTVTAVVGATGAGKSTLVDLVGGVLAPTTGTVRLHPPTGAPTGAGPQRRATPIGDPLPGVAVVFQEAFLFGGTVRDNIVVGRTLDDADVRAALELAQARDFVDDLPDGVDTVVGERGVTLSGGQRQRIALARALAAEPDLLVLDDTTSALDPATELAVLDSLRSRLAATTIVMVASRPSTIALADDVIYLAHGTIADHGTHARLMSEAAGYRRLVEAFETDRSAAARVVASALGATGPDRGGA